MISWTIKQTTAATSASSALKVVDNILSFVKDTKGKPSEKERALFAAAVVFTYGVWESFVEQLATEIAAHLATEISEHNVPDAIRVVLQKKTAWELAVSPGWRALWQHHVRGEALGDDAERHGMNTARHGNVKRLLALAGVTEAFSQLGAQVIPQHHNAKGATVETAIDALVTLRGEIAHTGKVPDALRKSQVNSWHVFVADLVDGLDKACRDECASLLKR